MYYLQHFVTACTRKLNGPPKPPYFPSYVQQRIRQLAQNKVNFLQRVVTLLFTMHIMQHVLISPNWVKIVYKITFLCECLSWVEFADDVMSQVSRLKMDLSLQPLTRIQVYNSENKKWPIIFHCKLLTEKFSKNRCSLWEYS